MEQIKDYIYQARLNGQSDAVIKQSLLSAGWDDATVVHALSSDGKTPENNSQYSPSHTESSRSGDVAWLNKIDAPKKWSEFQHLKSLLSGLGIVFAMLIIGGFIYIKDNHQVGLILGGLGCFFGLLVAIGSWISYRQLRRSEQKPQSYSQFQTSTATEYSTPSNSMFAQQDTKNETVINWIGPVIRADKGAVSHSILSKEVLKQAENTLLFTPTQIIAIMLTPDDTQSIQQGSLGNAASAYINYSSDTAANKNQEFRVLHSRKWEQLIANIESQPLQNVIQSHISYSIPYENIKSFKVKNSLVNPGYIFNLSDGSSLRFGLYRKDKMNEITDFLRQHVELR